MDSASTIPGSAHRYWLRPAPALPPGQPGDMDTTQPAGRSARRTKGRPGLSRVRLSSPADILAAVPHLLGFHPSRSLVVIGAGGPRDRVKLGFRYDLPDPPHAGTARHIAEHAAAILAGHRATTVIAVGYGQGRLVTPLLDVFTGVARQGGLAVRELLRVEDGRYWSYLCQDVNCCPAEGVPFDPGSHPVTAAMSAAGLAAYPDRAALARTLAPLTGERATARDEAAGRACAQAAALVEQAAPQGGNPLRLVISEGRRAVRGAIARYRDGGAITDDDLLAWLVISLAHLPVRDDAWARMDPAHRAAHLRLWTDLVRGAADAWVPAPAALLAFTAWQCGDGALASIAIDRALACDPGYSMALLLRDILDAGVPPSEARLPMTPDEVERGYEGMPGPGPGQPGAQE